MKKPSIILCIVSIFIFSFIQSSDEEGLTIKIVKLVLNEMNKHTKENDTISNGIDYSIVSKIKNILTTENDDTVYENTMEGSYYPDYKRKDNDGNSMITGLNLQDHQDLLKYYFNTKYNFEKNPPLHRNDFSDYILQESYKNESSTEDPFTRKESYTYSQPN